MNEDRFARIGRAYTAALDGRDPDTVDIVDLLPAIFDAVPDTSPEEIIDMLRWSADKALREAEQLKRYLKAFAGQRANIVVATRDAAKFDISGWKHARPGDGTLPFKKRGTP